jgi:hypothetical protein
VGCPARPTARTALGSLAPARVGRRKSELKGEPIPATSRPGAISPDGHLMAYLVGNRVELIPLQPDAVELAYRRDLMRPNFRLYREAYNAAVKAKGRRGPGSVAPGHGGSSASRGSRVAGVPA